jgi:Calx-beta domain-containing protein
MLIKQLFRFSTPGFNKTRLLGLICLLFVTAGITYAQGTPSVSINDITIDEGDSNNPLIGWDFTVSLSAPSTQPVSVTVSTQAGSATSNVDFGAGSAIVTFQPGQTSSSLTVFVIADTAVEGTEDFFLNLSNPVNATIGDGQGVATIIDDDALLLLNQTSSTRGVALDSVTYVAETIPIITERNFSADQRARLIVFAIGTKLANGETAAAVTATAQDSTGTVRPLTVEDVRKVPGFPWLTQVVLKLTDQIVPGDVKVKISMHNQTSNTILVALKAQ